MTLKVKLDDGAFELTRAYTYDAGFDLKSPGIVVIPARGSACIDTGVHFQIPAGYAGMLVSKSGLNVKHSITSTGLIDSGYSGSVIVKLYNNNDIPYVIEAGDKISQIVIVSVYTPALMFVDEIECGDRGDRGFGSSG